MPIKNSYNTQKKVENENLIIPPSVSLFAEGRSLKRIQFFPLKEINCRRQPGKDQHRKQPEGFVVNGRPYHIEKQGEPEAQQKSQT